MGPAPAPNEPHWLVRSVDDLSLRACAIYAVLVLVTPPEGIAALELCPCMTWTQAPCPGCGMTRCGANLVRGRVGRAVAYHPLGIAVIPLLFAAGAVGLLPRRRRDGFRRWLLPRARLLAWSGALLLGTFVAFGCVRWCLVWSGRASFPPAVVRPAGLPAVADDPHESR
jgi:hypothetical protein